MYKWKPSKAQKAEFKNQMDKIADFCKQNQIHQSAAGDSYYFSLNGKNYRISNHTIQASNNAAFDEITGEQKREFYHTVENTKDLICIFAGKTRIIDIYNDLKSGYELDGKGNRK